MLAPAGLSLLVTSYPGAAGAQPRPGHVRCDRLDGIRVGRGAGRLLVEVTWRLVFFVNAPVGVALLIASFRLLPPDPPDSKGQLDVPGAILVTAGVALLVFAVARGVKRCGLPSRRCSARPRSCCWARSWPGRRGRGPRFSTWPS